MVLLDQRAKGVLMDDAFIGGSKTSCRPCVVGETSYHFFTDCACEEEGRTVVTVPFFLTLKALHPPCLVNQSLTNGWSNGEGMESVSSSWRREASAHLPSQNLSDLGVKDDMEILAEGSCDIVVYRPQLGIGFFNPGVFAPSWKTLSSSD